MPKTAARAAPDSRPLQSSAKGSIAPTLAWIDLNRPRLAPALERLAALLHRLPARACRPRPVGRADCATVNAARRPHPPHRPDALPGRRPAPARRRGPSSSPAAARQSSVNALAVATRGARRARSHPPQDQDRFGCSARSVGLARRQVAALLLGPADRRPGSGPSSRASPCPRPRTARGGMSCACGRPYRRQRSGEVPRRPAFHGAAGDPAEHVADLLAQPTQRRRARRPRPHSVSPNCLVELVLARRSQPRHSRPGRTPASVLTARLWVGHRLHASARRQLRQPGPLRHPVQRAAEPVRDVLHRPAAAVDQRPDPTRLLDGAQVLALQVLRDQDLERLAIVELADDRRDPLEPRQAGTPASAARRRRAGSAAAGRPCRRARPAAAPAPAPAAPPRRSTPRAPSSPCRCRPGRETSAGCRGVVRCPPPGSERGPAPPAQPPRCRCRSPPSPPFTSPLGARPPPGAASVSSRESPCRCTWRRDRPKKSFEYSFNALRSRSS